MLQLIEMGGWLFTWPLVLLFVSIVVLAGSLVTHVMSANTSPGIARRLDLLLHLGVFSAVFGILGQAIGLYQAMEAIESIGGVSPALLAGGLKVSSIPTLFGLFNLAIALAAWTALRFAAKRKKD